MYFTIVRKLVVTDLYFFLLLVLPSLRLSGYNMSGVP